MAKYHNKSKFYSGLHSFWVFQKNRKAAKSVSIYDILTLYTKIPHDKLIKTLNSVIDFNFKGRTQNKISINSCRIDNRCNFFPNIWYLASTLFKKLRNILIEIATLQLEIKFFNK